MLRRWRSLKRRTKLTLVGTALVLYFGVHAPEPLEVLVYLPDGVHLLEGAEAVYTPNRCIPFLSCRIWVPRGPLTSTPLSIESAAIDEDHQLKVDVAEDGKTVRVYLPRQYVFSFANYELVSVSLDIGHNVVEAARDPLNPQRLHSTSVRGFRVVDEWPSRVAAARVSTRPHIDSSGRINLTILGHRIEEVEGWWPFQRLVLKVEVESEVR